VVVVGQDFSGTSPKGSDRPYGEPQLTLPTNQNLLSLIGAAGLVPERDVYLTNSVLCMKPGKMSARVPAEWVKNCSVILRRTIEIVAPQAVAALGTVAWRALGLAFDLRLPQHAKKVGQSPVGVPCGPALFAMGHPGGLGLANRPLAVQTKDWKNLGEWLKAVKREAA
jgi:uracil-DNA glycosylase family 4